MKAYLKMACILCLYSTVNGSILTMNTSDRGWFNEDGLITNIGPASTNYSVGFDGDGQASKYMNKEMRNFFIFEIPALEDLEEITSARLSLNLEYFAFNSPDPYETLQLYDVTSNVQAVSGSPPAHIGRLIFDDLGTGTLYGSINVTQDSDGGMVNIHLNHKAIADIFNRQGGIFVIGGKISTLTSVDGVAEELFNWSHMTPLTGSKLILEVVPEPATLCLLGMGGILLIYGKRGS